MKKQKISRRLFLDRLIRGGICIGFGYPIVIEPNWPILERVEVPITGLPQGLDGLKIGLLADFHKGNYITKSDIKVAIKKLQKQKPDLILLAGDYVEGKAKNILSCEELFRMLKAPLGVFSVLGNHDYWTDPMFIRTALQKFHIPALMNQSMEIKWNGESFFLIGLDDAWMGQPDIKVVLKGVPDDAMKILLVHEPDYAENIKSLSTWLPLQLSGHSHGGQVNIPFMGPPILPYLGRKYPMGLQHVSGMDRWVYTTRGVGLTLPIRFNCKPEVTLLTLRSVS